MAKTKEEKAAEKVIKKAETQQKQALKDAQKAEVKFLKAEGASKQEVKAEQKANTQEFKDAKGLLSAQGLQYIPQRAEDGYIRSNVGTYAETYAAAIQPKIEQAIGLLSEYNIPQSTTRETDDATIQTGMSLNNAYALSAARASGQPITAELLKAQYGNYVSGANKQANIFNAVNRFATDDAITASDFTKNLKAVKGQENLFTSKIGGGTTGVFQYNPETDTYNYLSATPVKVTEKDGGFLSSLPGQLLVGVAGGLLLGPTASLLATGSTAGAATLASTIGAGALLGAAGSALTGGDILTGALTGGIGGGAMFGIGQAGGLGNVINRTGIRLPTNVTNALNYLVSGVGTPTAQNAQLAADVLTASGLPTTADDIIGSIARETTEAGFPAGSNILDDFAPRGGIMNQVNPNVVTNIPGTGFTAGSLTTPGGYGLTSAVPGVSEAVQNSFANVAFANADEVINAARQAAQAAGQNISLTMPGGTQIVTSTPTGSISYRDFPQRPGLFDELAQGARGLADDAYRAIRENPLEALGLAGALASGVGGGGTTTGGGVGRPPRLAPDIDLTEPGQFGPGGGAIPGFGPGNLDFNAFMDLYRRGGLGAGQYLGYDLARMLGDIPAQTLLGTPTLGGMIGQAPTSQASLV